MTPLVEAARTVPVVDGLFEGEADGSASLIATHCQGCGSVYFPRSPDCRNPRCHDKRVEVVRLDGTGTLYSYTVQQYRPPPLFRMTNWAPYALGVVDLAEGVQVMGMLSGVDLAAIEIGMDLRCMTVPLYEDEDRGTVTTYAFTPAAGTPR